MDMVTRCCSQCDLGVMFLVAWFDSKAAHLAIVVNDS